MMPRAPLLVLTLSLAALSLACGDSGGLPTGPWHPYGGNTGGGGTTGGGGPASNGSTNGGTASNGSSSGGGTASNGSSGGGSTSSGGSSSSGSGSSGASSSSGSPTQSPPNLGVSVDQPTLKSQLMASNSVQVSIAPNGYSGSATLSLASMPTGVTGTFDNAQISLDDGRTTATATLTLKTADSAPPGTANIEVDVTVPTLVGQPAGKATIALTVQSAITVHIPMGVDNMGGTVTSPVTTAYGPYPTKITAPQGISAQNPVIVYFMNDDSVPHEIHASSDQEGFGHDPGPIAPMSMDPYVRAVNATGSFNYYLHDQGAPITVGLIEVQ